MTRLIGFLWDLVSLFANEVKEAVQNPKKKGWTIGLIAAFLVLCLISLQITFW